MPRHRGVQSDTDSLKKKNKNNEKKTIVSYSSSIHTFDISMKARPKGHIATNTELNCLNWHKRALQLCDKNIVLTNATLLR